MIVLPQLEMHIAHACNLACDGCRHYSNLHFKGVIPFEVGEKWLRAWAKRVVPVHFKILGGEPTLNREVSRYVRLAADLWPSSRRVLTTNGLTLHLRPELEDAIKETGTRVFLSRHHNTDDTYLTKLGEAVALLDKWGVTYTLDDATQGWYRGYSGAGSNIIPFPGERRKSWGRCDSKYCAQLHRNRLWKCPPLAYWGMYREKFPDVKGWQEFNEYQSVGLEATDYELHQFASEEDISACALCPSEPVSYQKSIR